MTENYQQDPKFQEAYNTVGKAFREQRVISDAYGTATPMIHIANYHISPDRYIEIANQALEESKSPYRARSRTDELSSGKTVEHLVLELEEQSQ